MPTLPPLPPSLQLKQRELSGQAENLHSVCESHREKIKRLFQTKLDEVRQRSGVPFTASR